MGEPLYQWPMPDGYPIKTSAWTGNMLPRWNFAMEFASGKIGGTGFDESPDVYVATQNKHVEADALARLVRETPNTTGLALGLSSPNFQWW